MMLDHPPKTLSFAEAIDMAEQLLDLEQEQIEEAFDYSRMLLIKNNCKSGKQYYNETYKEDKQ